MMMMEKDEHERARDRDRGGRRDRPTRFASSDRDRSPDRGKERGGLKSSNCRVYVSNIPYEFRWQDLKDLFRQQVGEVAFVELFVDENDKARGCGIVEFAEPSAAKKCLEVMHRFDLKGRKMVIKEDFGNQRDKYGNLVGGKGGRRGNGSDRDQERGDRGGRGDDHRGRYEQHGPSGGGGGGGGGVGPIVGNTYGLSPAFLEDLNIQTPLNTRVFVANLEYKVDKKKLKEVFRMAGKVLYVDVPLAKDGTSRGFAVIEYDHPVESVQAISMFNGQPLYDRPMTVRMDRGAERDKLPDGLKSIGNGLGSNGEPLRDVARNLPSLIGSQPAQTVAASLNSGAGILGAVPNLQLGAAANALGSLSSSALSNLGTTQAAVLQQAASLGLSNNLLAANLGGGDLGLGAANLLQNNPSLAALAAGGNSMGNSFNRGDSNNQSGGFMSNNQGGGGGGGGGGNYGGGGGGNQNQMGQNMGRNNYSTGYEAKPSVGGGGYNFSGNNGNERDRPPQHAGGNMYNSMNSMNNGGNQMMRGGGVNLLSDRKKCKLLISNLPPTAQYKLITEKCQEFGAVENFEEQGPGSLLVTFQTEWDADRAMKNIDRARIDGRTIDARVI